MSRAREWFGATGPVGGGITFYPYQLAIGVTVRYWPRVFAPTIRLHIGPIKIWGYMCFKKIAEATGDD